MYGGTGAARAWVKEKSRTETNEFCLAFFHADSQHPHNRIRSEQYQLGPQSNRNLMSEAESMRIEKASKPVDEIADRLAEEEEILRAIRASKDLKSAQELATGISYTESVKTGWVPPRHLRERPEIANDAMREQYHITLEGTGCPPMCPRFVDMKLHPALIKYLDGAGVRHYRSCSWQLLLC
jgi:hypothetical protein